MNFPEEVGIGMAKFLKFIFYLFAAFGFLVFLIIISGIFGDDDNVQDDVVSTQAEVSQNNELLEEQVQETDPTSLSNYETKPQRNSKKSDSNAKEGNNEVIKTHEKLRSAVNYATGPSDKSLSRTKNLDVFNDHSIQEDSNQGEKIDFIPKKMLKTSEGSQLKDDANSKIKTLPPTKEPEVNKIVVEESSLAPTKVAELQSIPDPANSEVLKDNFTNQLISESANSNAGISKTGRVAEVAQMKRALKPVKLNPTQSAPKVGRSHSEVRNYDTVELGKAFALVIGINNYSNEIGKLASAVTDAEEVAKILDEDFDFEVTTLLDSEATRANIIGGIERIAEVANPEDRVLIYYAGHGEYLNEKAFWLPYDAEPNSRANWIQSDSLNNVIKGFSALQVLLVADSCYSGATSFSSAQTPNVEIEVLLKRAARVLITSGGVEPVLDTSPNGGGHSIFARAFLRQLREIPYQTFSARELYEGNLEMVHGSTVQRPEFRFLQNSGHDGGIFLLRRAGTKVSSSQKINVQRTTWLESRTGMNFRFVEGGCFEMGSDKDLKEHRVDEMLHRVCVSDFWLADKEVTNAQYRKYKLSHNPSPLEGIRIDQDDHPAVRVNWIDADAFANWLTRKYGETVSFRLPTEAEWEFACKKGWDQSLSNEALELCDLTSLADQSLDQYSKAKRWKKAKCSDGFALSAPSGTYPADEMGLHDILGNVWEWVEDSYVREYSLADTDDPLQRVGKNKVLRGGSWKSSPGELRCARRRNLDPDKNAEDLGFRLVRTVN